MIFNDENSILLSKRLKKLREEKKLSHEKLCEHLQQVGVKIGLQSLKNFEVKKKDHSKFEAAKGMKAETLFNLAEFYGVSVDYLLGRTKVKSINDKVRASCEVTGLSEEAIHQLEILNTKKQYRAYTDLLSIIISNPNIEYMIGLCETYIAGSYEKENISTASFSAIDFSEKDVAVYAINNTIKLILDQITCEFLTNYKTSIVRAYLNVLDKRKHKITFENEQGLISTEEMQEQIKKLENDIYKAIEDEEKKYIEIIKNSLYNN